MNPSPPAVMTTTTTKTTLFDKVMEAKNSPDKTSDIVSSLLNDPEPVPLDSTEQIDDYENNNNVHMKPAKETFDPGDFTLPFKKGKNAGKKLKDMSENDLKSTLIFCDEKGLANVAIKIREYFNYNDKLPF